MGAPVSKQHRFMVMLANLIHVIDQSGYQVSGGELWRPPETAQMYAHQGKGIEDSLHISRLAIDLNLFKDGKYLTQTDEYEYFGRIWEAWGGSWGGRFGDGNHFSLSHDGKK